MGRRAVLAIAMLAVSFPAAAGAATIDVTTGADGVADDGQCTLREAISSANADTSVGGCAAGAAGADEVRVPAFTVALSAPGTSDNTNAGGDLDITSEVVVRGAGRDATTVD